MRARRHAQKVFGSFKNVFLSAKELEKLKTEFPRSYSEKIERLSEYMYQHGKNYRDHYLLLVKWLNQDEKDGNGGSFDLDEFFNIALKRSYDAVAQLNDRENAIDDG